jgi:hypothetical protein
LIFAILGSHLLSAGIGNGRRTDGKIGRALIEDPAYRPRQRRQESGHGEKRGVAARNEEPAR